MKIFFLTLCLFSTSLALAGPRCSFHEIAVTSYIKQFIEKSQKERALIMLQLATQDSEYQNIKNLYHNQSFRFETVISETNDSEEIYNLSVLLDRDVEKLTSLDLTTPESFREIESMIFNQDNQALIPSMGACLEKALIEEVFDTAASEVSPDVFLALKYQEILEALDETPFSQDIVTDTETIQSLRKLGDRKAKIIFDPGVGISIGRYGITGGDYGRGWGQIKMPYFKLSIAPAQNPDSEIVTLRVGVLWMSLKDEDLNQNLVKIGNYKGTFAEIQSPDLFDRFNLYVGGQVGVIRINQLNLFPNRLPRQETHLSPYAGLNIGLFENHKVAGNLRLQLGADRLDTSRGNLGVVLNFLLK